MLGAMLMGRRFTIWLTAGRMVDSSWLMRPVDTGGNYGDLCISFSYDARESPGLATTMCNVHSWSEGRSQNRSCAMMQFRSESRLCYVQTQGANWGPAPCNVTTASALLTLFSVGGLSNQQQSKNEAIFDYGMAGRLRVIRRTRANILLVAWE